MVYWEKINKIWKCKQTIEERDTLLIMRSLVLKSTRVKVLTGLICGSYYKNYESRGLRKKLLLFCLYSLRYCFPIFLNRNLFIFRNRQIRSTLGFQFGSPSVLILTIDLDFALIVLRVLTVCRRVLVNNQFY